MIATRLPRCCRFVAVVKIGLINRADRIHVRQCTRRLQPRAVRLETLPSVVAQAPLALSPGSHRCADTSSVVACGVDAGDLRRPVTAQLHGVTPGA